MQGIWNGLFNVPVAGVILQCRRSWQTGQRDPSPCIKKIPKILRILFSARPGGAGSIISVPDAACGNCKHVLLRCKCLFYRRAFLFQDEAHARTRRKPNRSCREPPDQPPPLVVASIKSADMTEAIAATTFFVFSGCTDASTITGFIPFPPFVYLFVIEQLYTLRHNADVPRKRFAFVFVPPFRHCPDPLRLNRLKPFFRELGSVGQKDGFCPFIVQTCFPAYQVFVLHPLNRSRNRSLLNGVFTRRFTLCHAVLCIQGRQIRPFRCRFVSRRFSSAPPDR